VAQLGIAVLNTLHGEVVNDPQKLANTLELNLVENLMINIGFPFDASAASAEMAGFQLMPILASVKLRHLNGHTLRDFCERHGFLIECDDGPFVMAVPALWADDSADPVNAEDRKKYAYDILKKLAERVKPWICKGWGYEIGQTAMEDSEFYELQTFKIQRQVIQDVEKAIQTACDAVVDIHERSYDTQTFDGGSK
jgi:hypothetical protein